MRSSQRLPGNRPILHDLFQQNQVNAQPGAWLDRTPLPLPSDFDFGRVEAMLIGLAVGDALGNTTEGQLPDVRKSRHGEIRDYLPNRHADNLPTGLPSDDTQMAFWTLEQLIQDGGLVPDHLAQRFAQDQIFGIGNSVKDFLRAYKDQKIPWYQASQPSAGNGALMRIAPVLVPHLRQPSPALWADAVLAGMVTHNEPASHACCVAFIQILWQCLCLREPPEPTWWIDTFSAVASQIEGETVYKPRQENLQYQGPLWQFVDHEVRQALKENLTVLEACQRWYSGAYLLETMPAVLYILARHGQNFEEALVRAVNDTKDNDTIAAIVGAALGALHGREAIPERWVKGLAGRLGAGDDWRLFELIETARQAFWHADEPLSRKNIQAVIAYLPLIQSPEFTAGKWIKHEGQLPYFEADPVTLRFTQALYENNFIISYNWPLWVEGQRFSQNPELLQRASLQTIRKLLTAHARSDRFIEGHLGNVLENGQMAAILRRLVDLANA